MNIFTKEEENQIIDMYKDNISIDDIISVFRCEEKDIRTALKNRCIDRYKNMFSDELHNRIIYLYKIGYTQTKISNVLLISDATARRTLKKFGVAIRPQTENRRVYNIDESYFDQIDTDNKAYLLGLLYADGCHHREHYNISIALQEQDINVLKFIKNELKYSGPLKFVNMKNKSETFSNQWALRITNKHLSDRLENIGLVKAKSLKLKFPEWLPENLYSSFIRGYFDGDGCVYIYDKKFACRATMVGTIDFCNKVANIIRNIGCTCSISKPQSDDKNTVTLTIGGNKNALKFLDWLYEDASFYMERKHQKYLYFKEKYLAKNNTQVA